MVKKKSVRRKSSKLLALGGQTVKDVQKHHSVAKSMNEYLVRTYGADTVKAVEKVVEKKIPGIDPERKAFLISRMLVLIDDYK